MPVPLLDLQGQTTGCVTRVGATPRLVDIDRLTDNIDSRLQECFAPVAEKASADTLALPIYSELTEAQQREVVAALGAALR